MSRQPARRGSVRIGPNLNPRQPHGIRNMIIGVWLGTIAFFYFYGVLAASHAHH